MDARTLFLQRLLINALKKSGVHVRRSSKVGQVIVCEAKAEFGKQITIPIGDLATYLADHGAGS